MFELLGDLRLSQLLFVAPSATRRKGQVTVFTLRGGNPCMSFICPSCSD